MLMQRALSVSELNDYVRRLLSGDELLRSLEVSGEISGFKRHTSGHCYFSLKDGGARVQCIMYRQYVPYLPFEPRDGMQVCVQASASLYAPTGNFQLYVNSMRKLGVGDLYQRFEELKAKLAREGLFDASLKQPIPFMPKCIGIATSLTGAAIRDIISVVRRRDPNVGFVVAPCAVQGVGAAEEIAQAIRRLNDDDRAQVILCGRGGGSMEELWAFNEEIVARAIAASRIPVISCVGHEIDFTIADFVADMRAATPSMAGEIAVPVISELKLDLTSAMSRVSAGLMQGNRVRRALLEKISAGAALRDPGKVLIQARRERLNQLWTRIRTTQSGMMQVCHTKLNQLSIKIEAMNPQNVLSRGYACLSVNGHLCSSAKELSVGMEIGIRMCDGNATARLLEVDYMEADHGREANI